MKKARPLFTLHAVIVSLLGNNHVYHTGLSSRTLDAAIVVPRDEHG